MKSKTRRIGNGILEDGNGLKMINYEKPWICSTQTNA